MGDMRRREIQHKISKLFAIARVDAPKFRAPQAPPRRYEITARDLFNVAARLKQLRYSRVWLDAGTRFDAIDTRYDTGELSKAAEGVPECSQLFN